MKRIMRLHVAGMALLIVLLLSVVPSFVLAYYYPNSGSLYYDGASYADSYLKWDDPGPWQHSDPGYEHDLVAHKNYFRDCTSWTNLPNGYNDCPTAGVSEPSDMWSFSFGTFHARNIQAHTWYFGSWVFLIGWDPSTNFYLNGQENYHGFCSWDSIWCMKASRTHRLLQGQFHLGQSYYGVW